MKAINHYWNVEINENLVVFFTPETERPSKIPQNILLISYIECFQKLQVFI
jgi:hypothetical protein